MVPSFINVAFASGNVASCTVQGLFSYFFYGLSVFSNASLAVACESFCTSIIYYLWHDKSIGDSTPYSPLLHSPACPLDKTPNNTTLTLAKTRLLLCQIRMERWRPHNVSVALHYTPTCMRDNYFHRSALWSKLQLQWYFLLWYIRLTIGLQLPWSN